MKKVFCILFVALLCMFVCVGCFGPETMEDTEVNATVDPITSRKEGLRRAYNVVGSGEYITLAYDNTSLVIDTNPNDSEYYNPYEDSAIAAIYSVHTSLGLPSSLIDKMSSTRALDGMQSQNCGDYTVTWNYHPDNGLKVIYEVNY